MEADNMKYIGPYVSIAGGVENAPLNAGKIGGTGQLDQEKAPLLGVVVDGAYKLIINACDNCYGSAGDDIGNTGKRFPSPVYSSETFQFRIEILSNMERSWPKVLLSSRRTLLTRI